MRLEEIMAGARRTPYAYGSSHPLEEVEVGAKRFIAKDLRRPVASKPEFLHNPERELQTYRTILEPSGLGTPRLAAAEDGMLLIEKVEGRELWQVGELELWQAVAQWLARAHAELAARSGSAFLLRYDEGWYDLWLSRAREISGAIPLVERMHKVAVERLLAEPVTVIHGEFYPSNVLVSASRVCVVDWEMAAAGPAIIDLAALVTGWGENEAAAIISAYGSVDARTLAAARLHLALRWLGWADGWVPPAEHRRDWRAEALDAAADLAD